VTRRGKTGPRRYAARSALRSAIRTLTQLLRDRLDSAEGELTDAQLFVDEIEAVAGISPRRAATRKR
jgi:hypothetical protein